MPAPPYFSSAHISRIAVLAGLAERLAIDVALLAPALGVRRDLLLHEAAEGVAEHLVVVLEQRARA